MVLRRHLREQGVADFKLPDRFIQVDSLPLTPVGKVDKNGCASSSTRNYRLRLREINRWPFQNLMITRCRRRTNCRKIKSRQVEPQRAALLIHDMQQYFLNFWGEDSALIKQVVENIANLRRYCKQQDIPVFYTAQPNQQSDEDRALLNDMWGRV